jgi:pimeloyl-ACP methyl ester carboxylesterase
LARHTRLILSDKRGTGLSDPVTRVPTLDERNEDLHAVLDAVGVERPALFGLSEGGSMSILFAATFPERVKPLVLYGTAARFVPELPDFPWGASLDEFRQRIRLADDHWGEGVFAHLFFNEAAEIPGVREALGRYERACASPAMAGMILRALMEHGSRVIVKVDIADKPRHEHQRDVAVAQYPVCQVNVAVARVANAPVAHTQ